jgi:hypothetical protein
MIDKDFEKFEKTGNVKDYLKFKNKKKENVEISKEIAPGDKNGIKKGDRR